MLTHGRRSTYSSGCRCDDCCHANAEVNRNYRARVMQTEAHGTVKRYNVGCRCLSCKEAIRERSRQRRALPARLRVPRAADWLEQRACRDMPTAVFFPDRGGSEYGYLRMICSSCPVRLECLDEALYFESFSGESTRFGFQGGMSPDERAVEAARRDGRRVPVRVNRRMKKEGLSTSNPQGAAGTMNT